MHRGFFTIPVIALVALIACKKTGDATGSTCPTNSTLTYDNFGKTFMTNYCTECHSSTGGKHEQPMLDDITSIRGAISDIDRTSAAGPNATNDVMPGDFDVAEDERRKLGEWLACGAP